MDRVELIQRAVESVGGKDYLEIGVETGKTIRNIVASNRVGVDPNYLFDTENEKSDTLAFFHGTSDQYFNQFAGTIDGVIYVDGLHTYEQTLKDIVNSLGAMSPRSMVIVDDCIPRDANEGMAAKSHAEAGGGAWCGDVWKSIVDLRINRENLNIFTVPEGPGMAIITFGKPKYRLNLNGQDINKLNYEYFNEYKDMLLNIKSEDYYIGFLEGRRQRIEG